MVRMEVSELCFHSATQMSHLIRAREISPVEVAEAHLARIEALEPVLNSFITLLADHAIAEARRAEEEILAGRYRGPLHGVPLGLKDLFYVKGVRNTSGSRIFDNFIPDFDCTLAARLREAGTVLLGKLNLDQFASGITGENNPDYGPMHNPWNPELIAGGSSGGSGSAVASGECTVAMGSDTGGSIRSPAAMCGLSGFKPTYGCLSRHGMVPFCWSMDHPGPMARTVEDCALIMSAIAGHDPLDAASARVAVPDYVAALTGNINGLRIGVPKEYFEIPLDPEVEHASREAIELLEALGAVVSEVSWPMFHQTAPIANTIHRSEAAALHSELLRTQGAEMYPPVRLRMETGHFVPAVDYIQAQQARALYVRQSRELFEEVDILAGPMEPVTAYKIGTTELRIGDSVIEPTAALTRYSRPFDLNGFPAITVPCGFSEAGLPIGFQLAGRPFKEETVLRVAHAYQEATEWHLKRPPL